MRALRRHVPHGCAGFSPPALECAEIPPGPPMDAAAALARMPVQDVGMFAWKRLDELIERGYEHALRELAPLRERLAA